MTSTDIINEAKSKYENLASYGFDWGSFYNGYVEGRIAGLPFIKEIVTVETPEAWQEKFNELNK